MNNNEVARVEGTQFEVVERDLVGSARYIKDVTDKLTAKGLLIDASPVQYDPAHGSYCVVRFRKPVGVDVPGTRPVVARVVPTRPAPAPVRKPARRRAAILGAFLAALLALSGLVAWVIRQVAEAMSAVDRGTAIGFVVIAVIVAVLLCIKSRRGGGGGGQSGRMGFHYGPCD